MFGTAGLETAIAALLKCFARSKATIILPAPLIRKTISVDDIGTILPRFFRMKVLR